MATLNWTTSMFLTLYEQRASRTSHGPHQDPPPASSLALNGTLSEIDEEFLREASVTQPRGQLKRRGLASPKSHHNNSITS